jgi:hypothetical protein
MRRRRMPKQLGPLGLLATPKERVSAAARAKVQILERVDLAPEKRSLVLHQPCLGLYIDLIER